MRTSLRRLAIASLLLALALPLAGRTRPRYGGTLRIELRETNWLASEALRPLVVETLTSVDASGAVQPWLATQWDELNGARRWRLHLRSGVTWHDGAPLTAASVVAALQAAVAGTELEGSSIRAEGDAVIVESARPLPELPALLALPRFALLRSEAGRVLGTGPFQVAHAGGNRVELLAYDGCWRGRPYLDGIAIATGRSIRDQWMDAAVKSTDIAAVPAEMIRRAQQERLRVVSSGNSELIVLQATAVGVTLDVRLRQALAATINREVLLSFAFQKQGEVSGALLPNWLTGYAPLFASEPDGARAHELRAQAGQTRPLLIGYPGDDATLQIVAERIAINAREHGIQSQAVSGTGADFVVRRVALPSMRPQLALQAMAEAVQTQLPAISGEAEELFRNERELLTEANLIPLLYVPRAFAVAERVHGANVNEGGELELGAAWIEERR